MTPDKGETRGWRAAWQQVSGLQQPRLRRAFGGTTRAFRAGQRLRVKLSHLKVVPKLF